jgi:hypothetical protein
MVLDPSKRRQKAGVERSLEGFVCPHGEPVTLNWHPRPDGDWFDIQAHCPGGERSAKALASKALGAFSTSR